MQFSWALWLSPLYSGSIWFSDLAADTESITQGDLRQRMRNETGVADKKEKPAIPSNVPRALHRFYQKGNSKTE